jgi:hypothetical protein
MFGSFWGEERGNADEERNMGSATSGICNIKLEVVDFLVFYGFGGADWVKERAEERSMKTVFICFWNAIDPIADFLLFCIFEVMVQERRRAAEKCFEELQAFGNIKRFGLILIFTTSQGGDKVRGMMEPGDIHISGGGHSGEVCMFVDFIDMGFSFDGNRWWLPTFQKVDIAPLKRPDT